jgi:hypothetical protein
MDVATASSPPAANGIARRPASPGPPPPLALPVYDDVDRFTDPIDGSE